MTLDEQSDVRFFGCSDAISPKAVGMGTVSEDGWATTFGIVHTFENQAIGVYNNGQVVVQFDSSRHCVTRCHTSRDDTQ